MIAAAAAITRLPAHWTPLGDNALVELWTRAVGSSSTPLVGGDARFGWNHLGPWVFYLLALPYRLLGSSAVGLLVGAAAINIVTLVAVMRCVRAVAGRGAAAVIAAGALLFFITATGDRLIDPWNPFVVQMPFLLAVVACWAVVNRLWFWCAWLVGAASLCVQSHIAFLAPAAVLVAIGGVALWRAPQGERRRPLVRTAVVAVIAWTPTAIDLFLPHRHNLYRVVKYFAQSSPSATAGVSTGLRVVLRETGLRASWLGGRVGVHLFTAGFDGGVGVLPGIGLVALVLVGLLAHRRRDSVIRSLALLLGVLLVVAVAEMSSARGELYPYLFGWVTIVGMLCWAAAICGAVRMIPVAGLDERLPWLTVAASLGLLAAGVGSITPRSPLERAGDDAIVRRLVAQVEPALQRGRRYRLQHGEDAFSSIYEHGLVNALRGDGYPVVVDPLAAVLFGHQLTDPNAAAYPTLAVVAPYEATPPGWTVIGLSDPLTTAERAHEAELVSTLCSAYAQTANKVASDIVRTADGNLVLVALLVDSDPSHGPLLQDLAALRSRGRSIAVELQTQP